MLKENNQLSFCLSSHASLYDILIEKNNFWRQLKDMVDFSFVYDGKINIPLQWEEKLKM